MLKFARRSLVIALLVLCCLVLFARTWFARSLPQVEGEIHLTDSGLEFPVEIVRDTYGIPHIYAKTDADMMFALGYVHAQDRLYQMEFQRRVSSGRISEFWGTGELSEEDEKRIAEGVLDKKDAVGKTAGADKFLRTMGFYQDAQRTWNTPGLIEDDARADLSAYTAGVNAFLGEGNPLPPEFTIAKLMRGTGTIDRPWSEVDSIAWLKIMALDLGANFRRELSRLHMAHVMEEDKIAEFYTPYPGTEPFILPDLNALFGLPAPDGTLAYATTGQDLGAYPAPAETLGSNNWVIDGSLMENGNSVLSNDPHLGLAVPGVWYFAHISSEESGTNAIGATLPGYPSIVIGRNDHIAWGFTNTGPDVQDLFVERISKQTGLYETPTGWEPLKTRTEIIEVAKANPIELTVRETRHGPLLSDILEVPAVFTNDAIHEYGFALQWTVIMDDLPDTSANAAARTFRATSYEEYLAAARAYVAPQQNMVVLENGGRIGHISPGRVPIRHADNKIEGWAPSPGWDAIYDWQGFIPHEQLPQTLAPAEGYIITANEDITADGYEHFITRDWSLPLRGNRIRELTVDRGRLLNLDDMKAAVSDQRINSAAQILPIMLAAVDMSGLSAEDQDTATRMIEALEIWAQDEGFDGNSDRIGPSLFFAWYRDFVYTAAADDLGITFDAETEKKFTFSRLFRFNPEFAEDLADGTAGRWCEGGSCGALLAQTLVTAHAALSEELGGNMRRWQWGRLHHAHSRHMLTDGIPVSRSILKPLTGLAFTIDREHGGGPYSVNVSGFPMVDSLDFRGRHTASLRLLVEAGKFQEAQFVHSQGQSGLPQSPHFEDMADKWAANEYVPMITDRETIEKSAEGTLTLSP